MQLASTPDTVPANAEKPLRVSPPTRKIIAADSTQTAPRHTAMGLIPRRQRGTTIFQMTAHENTKESTAFTPIAPAYANSSTAKIPSSAKVQPVR